MKKLPDDSIVRLIDLPPGIGGAVMEDEDGFVSIYINARHGHDAQRHDLDHEIAHVDNDDLHNADGIEAVEARAKRAKQRMKRIPRLMKARDLMPPPPPKPKPELTPRQARILMSAISELDRFTFSDQPSYED